MKRMLLAVLTVFVLAVPAMAQSVPYDSSIQAGFYRKSRMDLCWFGPCGTAIVISPEDKHVNVAIAGLGVWVGGYKSKILLGGISANLMAAMSGERQDSHHFALGITVAPIGFRFRHIQNDDEDYSFVIRPVYTYLVTPGIPHHTAFGIQISCIGGS